MPEAVPVLADLPDDTRLDEQAGVSITLQDLLNLKGQCTGIFRPGSLPREHLNRYQALAAVCMPTTFIAEIGEVAEIVVDGEGNMIA